MSCHVLKLKLHSDVTIQCRLILKQTSHGFDNVMRHHMGNRIDVERCANVKTNNHVDITKFRVHGLSHPTSLICKEKQTIVDFMRLI